MADRTLPVHESCPVQGCGICQSNWPCARLAKLCIEWANSKSTSNLSQIRSSEITPPDDLVRDWARFQNHEDPESLWRRIATLASRWGSNQELEACVNWLDDTDWEDPQEVAQRLRAARRPKPPSLKEQALEQLREVNAMLQFQTIGVETSAIRRALEALNG